MQSKAEKIKKLIAAKGYTVTSFAEEIGYNQSAFSRAINDDPVNARLAAKIATKLCVPIELINSDEEVGPGNMPEIASVTPNFPMGKEETGMWEEMERLRRENAEVIFLKAENAEIKAEKSALIEVIKNLTQK